MNPSWIYPGRWFMDRMSCMRREGTPARMQVVEPCRERRPRMPVAAQTRLYHPALAGAPPEEGNWNHLGGLFLTPLYHLHPCRRASMQAGARYGENAIFTARLSSPNALISKSMTDVIARLLYLGRHIPVSLPVKPGACVRFCCLMPPRTAKTSPRRARRRSRHGRPCRE